MRPTGLNKIVKELFVIILIWMLIGCASQQRPSTPRRPSEAPAVEPVLTPESSSGIPVSKKPEFYVHKVRWPGETISVIAQWYTGSQKNCEVIVKVNSDLDPKRMNIGAMILIPADILKTREPMPRKYLRASIPKRDTSSSRAKPAKEFDKTKAADSPEKDRGIAEFDKIELFDPQDIEESVPKSDEIELFGPVE